MPFYICDAALQPCEAEGVPVEFYAIDEAFDPILPAGAPAAGECLVYVNYFGVKTSTAARLAAAHGRRMIVDDTHAFFARGYAGAWSFNSARKFFGVPDGGYAYGAGLSAVDYPRPSEVRYEHLVNRLIGRQELAYEQYLQSESLVTPDLCRMSVLSERLLAGVDYPAARERRLANFAALHEAFGARNCLTPHLAPEAGDVPYCYPLLSTDARAMERTVEARHLRAAPLAGCARAVPAPVSSRGNRCWPTACCRCRSITGTMPGILTV